jgi:hypothetical protein
VVVVAGLEEGRRLPATSSEVPDTREPFDAMARHDTTPGWSSGWPAAWDNDWSSGIPALTESWRRRLPAAQPWRAWHRLVAAAKQACSGASSSTAKQSTTSQGKAKQVKARHRGVHAEGSAWRSGEGGVVAWPHVAGAVMRRWHARLSGG